MYPKFNRKTWRQLTTWENSEYIEG